MDVCRSYRYWCEILCNALGKINNHFLRYSCKFDALIRNRKKAFLYLGIFYDDFGDIIYDLALGETVVSRVFRKNSLFQHQI